MRSLVVMGTSCLCLFIATSILIGSTTPDPAMDIEKAWRSLQAIAGTWTTDGQNQVAWKQDGQTRLKKIVIEAGEQRIMGQLIREKDAIIYEFEQEETSVSLKLQQALDSTWVFTTETEELLQKIELSLINGKVLKNEIVAQSPSGRRFSIQSEMSRH